MDAVGLDGRGDGSLARLRLERGRQTAIGEQRRIDPAREVPEIVEGALERLLQRRHRRAYGLGTRRALCDPLEEAQLDAEGDELLLSPIVQVALDLPALEVLRFDQPPPRRTELVDRQPEIGCESDIAQHEAGLRR